MEIDELDVSEELRRRVAATGQTTDTWPVIHEGQPHVLAVRAGALCVYGLETERVFRWSELRRVVADGETVGLRAAHSPTMTRFGLVSVAHGPQIMRAVERAGGPVGAPEGPTDAEQARRALNLAIAGGIVLQLVAAFVLWVVAARQPEVVLDGAATRSDSPGATLFALLLASAGGLCVLLGVIGWGVVLGLRAARRP